MKKILSILTVFALVSGTLVHSAPNAYAAVNYYGGDGTCYTTGKHEVTELVWDLSNPPDSYTSKNRILFNGDTLKWKSAARNTVTGIHNPIWCSGDPYQQICGHYGEDVVVHEVRTGLKFIYKDSLSSSFTTKTTKEYEFDAVDETAMTTREESSVPVNAMIKESVVVDESLSVISYPTKVTYVGDHDSSYSYKRCGSLNAANEHIAYETFARHTGYTVEVRTLNYSKIPVRYNLNGGIVEKGKGLPSDFAIEDDYYDYDVNVPVKLGFFFKEWTDADTENRHFVRANKDKIRVGSAYDWWDEIDQEAVANITLEASWATDMVKILFDVNGGDELKSNSVNVIYNETNAKDTELLQTPTKNGYAFDGWYIDDTKITCIDDIPASAWNQSNEYTVTAKWKIDAASGTTSSAKPSAGASTAPSEKPSTEPSVKPSTAPTKGETVTDEKSGVQAKVVNANEKEVSYVTSSADQKSATIKVPSSITVNGTSYKVVKIEDGAFANNKVVTKVTLPNSVLTIGKNAFKDCSKLKTITIPGKVNQIGSNAFYGCKKLKQIELKTTKLKAKNVGKNAFKGISKSATMKVPKKQLKTYKQFMKKKGFQGKLKSK